MSKRSEQLDRNWEAAKADLVEAADKAGIDPGILAKMAGLESGFDATARPISRDANRNTVTQYDDTKAMSSAHGYGQLTNDTWAAMIHRYGEKYGVPDASTLTKAQANTAVYRDNTSLQAGMFAELTRENIVAVAGTGGDDVSSNIYAYHNLGQRTGATFLTAVQSNPEARVDTVLSKEVIKGNSGLYGDGTISVAAAYQKMTDTLAVYEKYATEVQRSQVIDPLAASAEASPHPASRPQALRQGSRAKDVGVLQNDLNALGYTDGQHATLRPDNNFGASTRAAVEAFQRDNHLLADGVVGPTTGKAIEEQVATRMRDVVNQPLSRLDSPDHPDHALFQQTRSLVHHLDRQLGRVPDQMSDNIASALVVSARSEGLHRIDKIALSDDGNRLWAVQKPEGMRYGFMDSYASVPTSSVSTSMEQSAAQWPQAMQKFQQQQEQAVARQQESRVQQQAAQQTAPEVGGFSR